MGRRLILSSRFMAKHVTALKYMHAGCCKTGEVSIQCLLAWVKTNGDLPLRSLRRVGHWHNVLWNHSAFASRQISITAVTLDLYHLTGHPIHTISTYKNSQRYVGCSHHLHPHQVEAAKATNHLFINHYYFQSLRLGSYSLRLEM